jgi:hypothetical protein
MRAQLQPGLESHLAAVVMRELVRPYEDIDDTYVDIVLDDPEVDESDEYALYEVASVVDVVTTQFVRARDPSRDHVITVEYPREAVAPDPEPAGLMFPLYSVPFERVDLHEVTSADGWATDPTEIVNARRSRLTVKIAAVVALAGTLAFGYAIVRAAM